jgi:lysylphosphatidylglycerol synthetase-like protein (DUF2156 family)
MMPAREPVDPQIADFIRQNRQRYTREAITDQLREAGYSREAVDATWDRLTSEEPEPEAQPEHDGGNGMGRFVWLAPVAGALIVVLSLIGYAGVSALVWWVAIALLVVVPAAWLSRHRPLAATAISAYLLLLVPVGFLSLVGAALSNHAGAFVWVGLFAVLGALLVWPSYRWKVPSSAAAWVGGIAGVTVLFLIVAGATCLASIPFYQV